MDFFNTGNGKKFLSDISRIATALENHGERMQALSTAITEATNRIVEELGPQRVTVDGPLVFPDLIEEDEVVEEEAYSHHADKDSDIDDENDEWNDDGLGSYRPESESKTHADYRCRSCGSTLDENYTCTGDNDDDERCKIMDKYQGPVKTKKTKHGECDTCGKPLNLRGYCLNNSCAFARANPMKPGRDFICFRCRKKNNGLPIMVDNRPMCKSCKN